MVLDSYYFELMSRVRVGMYIAESTGIGSDWASSSYGNFRILLETAPGRAWWRSAAWEPEIQAMGDRVWEITSGSSCRARYDKLRSAISSDTVAPPTRAD